MDLAQSISAFLEQQMPSDAHFLVDVSVKTLGSDRMKVSVLADSDKGITIEECGILSRKLGKWLEENSSLSSAYTLEVSSPGVDFPLQSQRSFLKNIGRSLLVITNDLEKLEGTLLEVHTEYIKLMPLQPSKKKTIVVEPFDVQLDKIKKATVQIVF